MVLSRRALLSAGLIGVLPPRSPRSYDPADADWQALAAGLAGTVERPGTSGYDQARQLFSPRFDPIRPPAVVRCANQADVVAAVAFANRFGLPIVPRGGGHSYVGASTSSTGLVLDLRPLRTVGFDAATATATIGGGATLLDVGSGLAAHGVSVPAGSCGSVGISGLTCGGGIGVASAAYGLTSDNVVSAEVVTADGKSRTVDAQRDTDLFWALRGGGGGRFGVVTSWRLRTHPAATAGTFTLVYPWADAALVVAGWLARISAAPDNAWSACLLESDRTGALSVRLHGSVLDGDAHAEVTALTRSVGRDPVSATIGHPSPAGTPKARATHLTGSEIFARPLPSTAVTALLAVLQRRAAAKLPGLAKLKRLTGAPARVTPGSTAFGWHGAHSMLQWLVEPATAGAVPVADAYTWIDAGHHAMLPWSAGRYVNYREPGPVDPVRYHGRNAARLERIRATVDPAGRFL
ncbi:FAD-binding oxidoreductase [Actinoplanes derwentensis]|uniref:FAD/FMN-containing dehydrogenase n=1 Tax=Actinoplanes derwentensis TaxID=113562 RepID=A0A1H1ZIF1_9ACTN|nr:FAD-binding oxidoreductase [Actinoplanes derwentensis]GID82456.1 hypothetical protein Ade03nite_13800 [Actinoplanes derwentensis]SDT33450.1 FAD/FMN-containing dehydrogenase [Actinoplanes derwentensis]